MVFYFITLTLSVLLSIVLFKLLIRSLQVNWERKNRLPLGYLTPVLLTAIFILLTTGLTVPRLLDTVNLLARTYDIEEIVLQKNQIHWNSLSVGQRRYFFNQWQFKPQTNQAYRISFTPHSRYIVEMQPVVESPDTASGPAPTSMQGVQAP